MRYAIALLVALWLPSLSSAQTIAYTFVVSDLANSPVNSVDVGSAFKLRVFVADVRPNPRGVFAAFVDVTYPAALATATGPIVHSLTYTFSQSGTSSPGVLNEVGGSDGLSPLGAGQFLVFEQAFMASATGDLTFVSDRPTSCRCTTTWYTARTRRCRPATSRKIPSR